MLRELLALCAAALLVTGVHAQEEKSLLAPPEAPRTGEAGSRDPLRPVRPARELSLSERGLQGDTGKTLRGGRTRPWGWGYMATRLAQELNARPGPVSPGQRLRLPYLLSDLGSSGRPVTGESDRLRNQLLSGLRETELRDEIAGSGAGTARVAYFRADPWDPRSAADAREAFNTQLDLRPTRSSRLFFSNDFSRQSLFTDSYEEIERERLRFEQNWNRSAATLMWEHRRADGFEKADSLDALSLSLSHPFSRSLGAEALFAYENSLFRGPEGEGLLTLREILGRSLEAQAGVQFRTSSLSGATLESALTLFARPGGRTEAAFALRQSDSARFGRTQRASANLTTYLSDRVQLTGEVSQRRSQKLGEVLTFGLGLAARPTARMLLETAFSESQGEQIGRERSNTVRLSLDPSPTFKLRVGYDLLNSTRDGSSGNALWMITLGGRRTLKLEGSTGRHEAADKSLYDDSLYRLEVRPAPEFAVSGSFRQVRKDGEVRSLAGVGTSLKLLHALEVSAAYRRPTLLQSASADLFGSEVKLSLAPVSGFRLFGEYTARPEDEQGALLDQVHRSVGLETRLGSFSLQGSVTSIEGSLNPGQRLDFLATLAFGHRARLYGGLRMQEGSPLDPSRSRIYRLGISQTAGPSLFLLLEGQIGWQVDATGAGTLNPDEARAQARLGLRF